MALGKPKLRTKFELASFSRCRNIKLGTPKFWGAPLAQGHAYFLFWVWFYDGLWQTQVHTKFEVASFSGCRNIKGEPQNFRELRYTRASPTFLLRLIFWWALANLRCAPNLKSLASAVAEILKKNPKILGSSPSPWLRPLFLLVWFYDCPCGLPNLKSLASYITVI